MTAEKEKQSKHHPLGPSSFERAYRCPGSVVLSEGIADIGSADANEGTLLHERVTTGDFDGLTEAQIELVTLCREQLERFAPVGEWQLEVELELLGPDFEVLAFGTADALLEDGDRCIIYDWKFGRVPVTPAADNMQLWQYAAGALQKTGAAQCICHIFQPRIRSLTEGVFGTHIVGQVQNCLQAIIEANQTGIILRYDEQHCKYCRAAINCPEYRRNVSAITTTHTSDITDPLVIARYLDVAKQAKKWAANVEHRAKQMIQFEKVPVPGWEMRARAGSREVTNAQKAYESTVGSKVITHEQFMQMVTLKIGDLENTYARARKDADKTPLKRAKEELATLLEGAVTRKPDSLVLYKTNENEGDDDNA